MTVERLTELWPAKVPALVMRGEHDFVFKVPWPLLEQHFVGDLMLIVLSNWPGQWPRIVARGNR